MKIIHAGHVPVPADHDEILHMQSQHPGRWVLNHALAQKSAGIDVEIVTQAHKASRDFTCNIEGVTVHFMRTYHPYRHFTFYAVDQLRIARKIRELHPDIVHAHGTEAAYGWAAQRTGIPYCITAQGLFFQILPTLGRSATLSERFLRAGEHIVLNRAKYMIAKSEYVRDALAAEYPNLDLSLIPNTYEPELDGALGLRAPHSLAFVGTIDMRKGVSFIVDSVKSVVDAFPDTVLHIAGNSPEASAVGFAGECLRALRTILGDNLVLHGKLTSKKLFSMLRGCAALVAPSLEEMFGNQLIEAIMCGCHGIVAEGTALAENARRFGNCTVVPQRDPNAIAEALTGVFKNPPDMACIENARSRIREYMSPSAVAAKHMALYERIAAGFKS